MPKTLAEIAIDAGLVTKASAARAGKLAEERRQPLVVVLVRELGVDELALVGALRKQTRVQLIDPSGVQVDPDALRVVPRELCARLRVLPLSVAADGPARVLRVAMADPTDTTAIAELEAVSHCEIEVSALPLSAIDELVDRSYRLFSTAVTKRPTSSSSMFITQRGRHPAAAAPDSPETENSVTAQIPIAMMQVPDDLEARLTALVQVLVGKGLVTEAELAEALRKK